MAISSHHDEMLIDDLAARQWVLGSRYSAVVYMPSGPLARCFRNIYGYKERADREEVMEKRECVWERRREKERER